MIILTKILLIKSKLNKPKRQKKQTKKKAKKEGAVSLTINESKLRKQIGQTPVDPGKQRQIDAMMESRKVMPYNPRRTAIDAIDDRHHLYRCLDKSLYLVIRKFYEEDPWQFPIAAWDGQETMRQTAERAVVEDIGSGFKTYFWGNAPEGHWVVHFNEEQKLESGFDGYKIFYYRVLLMGGEMTLNSEDIEDYAWSSKQQLGEYFTNPEGPNRLFQHMFKY